GQLGARNLRWQLTANRLWLIMLFVEPLAQSDPGWRWLWPTVLSIPVYLYLYWQSYADASRRQVWYCAGMVVLGFIVCPFNGVALGYTISGCVWFAAQPSWRRWLVFVGMASLPAVAVAMRLDTPWWLMLLLLAITPLSGLGQHLRMANLRKDVALRLSQDEVRRLATLAERERIGRDLHDLLGHTLSLVTLKSELARKLALADPPRAQREMEEVERVSRHALAEVRAAVTGMRRSDLSAELVSARLMLEASNLAFEAGAPAVLDLPAETEATLALVLREAVTNIHRHANATTARVVFSCNAERFHMRISDNGRGGLAAHGNGISGMRERVRALGGTLSIDSPARRGTTLDVEVYLCTASKPAAANARPVPALADQGSAA